MNDVCLREIIRFGKYTNTGLFTQTHTHARAQRETERGGGGGYGTK